MAEWANTGSKPRVGFGEAIKQGFRGYVGFRGRATRAEYWWWVLFVFLASLGFSIVDGIIRAATGGNIFGIFEFLFFLATFLPYLAVTARRLHDIGKTGWWLAIWYILPSLAWVIAVGLWIGAVASAVVPGLAPPAFALAIIISIIAVFLSLGVIVWSVIWLVQQGDPGPNRYGPDPRTWDSPEAPEVF